MRVNPLYRSRTAEAEGMNLEKARPGWRLACAALATLAAVSGNCFPASASEESVRGRLESVRQRASAFDGRLESMQMTLADPGTHFEVKAYRLEEVRPTLEGLREQIEAALAEAPPLLAYVRGLLPSLDSLRPPEHPVRHRDPIGDKGMTVQGRADDRPETGWSGAADADWAAYAASESVEQVVARLVAVIDRVLARSLAVDLRIVSKPRTGAAFHINDQAGGSDRDTSTDDTLKQLWRGLYRYNVTKSGYKTIEGGLDLWDDSGSELSCELVGEKSAESATPCKLE